MDAVFKMMRPRFALIGLAWGLLPIGCGGSDEDADSAADFSARYAGAWCSLQARCCQQAGGMPEGGCEAGAESLIAMVAEEAQATGATWDGAAAERCLDAVRNADCALPERILQLELADACDDVWQGVVPPGGACRSEVSCAKPEVSDGASAAVSCVNSTCVQAVRQPIGAPCSADGTLVCDSLVATCQAGSCVALPELGQACSGECRAGAECSNGVCVSLLADGEACSYNLQCRSELCYYESCQSGTCTTTCQAVFAYCAIP